MEAGGGDAHCWSDGDDGVADSQQNHKMKGSSRVTLIRSRCLPSMGSGYGYADGSGDGSGGFGGVRIDENDGG